jgi:hypothetical protein
MRKLFVVRLSKQDARIPMYIGHHRDGTKRVKTVWECARLFNRRGDATKSLSCWPEKVQKKAQIITVTIDAYGE